MKFYFALRHLHMLCAALSIGGFFLRGLLLLRGSDLPRRPAWRRLTDSNDSLLLLAAIGMVAVSGQYPFVVPWVTAKLLGLIAYIGLGLVAFRFARRPGERLAAWLAALAVAAYIVSVAFLKTPTGFFGVLL
ncbi:MAG TPA: SirB2 family protein [Rhodocyclaceae bacterium]